ncbi:hypothetical protein [uncultured Vagococcus sp.]|uniref:O-antigen ligase family protein n=1 Tax=uncultured Vagococcus sp. TaxID=189676 RepID=UPI0028D709EB|nr:hypothetical protein [uncultured Vagococcus sp.]
MNGIFEFITMAFPKAGIQVGGLPLTLNMILFGVVMLANLKHLPAFLNNWGGFLIGYYLFFFFSTASLLINIAEQQSTSLDIAMTMVVILSPLASVPISRLSLHKSMTITCVSAIIVGGYMIVQKTMGITKTAVAGVTYTLGQDLTTKPIGYATAENLSHKMPSTYQNGNSSGLFLVSSLTLLLIWQPERIGTRCLKYGGILACLIGVFLCGSRSILFPMIPLFIMIGLDLYKQYEKEQRKIVWIVFGGGIIAVSAYFNFFGQEALTTFYDRVITQTIQNPSSDRFAQWKVIGEQISVLSPYRVLRFLFIGVANDLFQLDGMLRFLAMKGVIAQLSFLAVLMYPIIGLYKEKKTRIVSYALIGIFIAFLIDMSFFYLPCIMNYFMVYEIALKFQQKARDNQEEKDVYDSHFKNF